MPVTAIDIVAEARARIREIAPDAFGAIAGNNVLIDVREPAEFATAHIQGAVDIPRGVLEFQVNAHPAVANVSDSALSDTDRPIVLYCRTGGRAALAACSQQQMGFKNVASLRGGITEWAAAGLPVTQH
jgi:rhodanese-related sulfurtransferase